MLSTCHVGRGSVAAFFHDWQTLISGGLAVLAALATVVYLHRQIALQQEQIVLQRYQYQQENRQKMKTALIGLPQAIVEIHSLRQAHPSRSGWFPDPDSCPNHRGSFRRRLIGRGWAATVTCDLYADLVRRAKAARPSLRPRRGGGWLKAFDPAGLCRRYSCRRRWW